jgi:hypothetical protein
MYNPGDPGTYISLANQKENKMTTEPNTIKQEQPKTKVIRQGGASEAVYGLGLIGAWVFYLSHAATFWIGVLGILKGIVWPAILVYEALAHIGL